MKKCWHILRSQVKIDMTSPFQRTEHSFTLTMATLLGLFSLFGICLILAITFIIKLPSYFELQQRLSLAQKKIAFLERKYNRNLNDLKITLAQLQQTEQKLRSLLKLKSRDKILERANLAVLQGGIGEVEDIDLIRKEVNRRLKSIAALQVYLKKQKSIYLATPCGFPTYGYISSGYGWRKNPITHKREFHYGVDVAAMEGTPVKSTADGIVVYVGRTKGSGNFVIIKHGYGYTTFYAHLKRYIVKVGQRVKRGQVIGYVGHTGLATGSHVHYEVWHHKKRVNPYPYLKGRKS